MTDEFEAQVRRTAYHFPYPQTPSLQRPGAKPRPAIRLYLVRAALSIVLLAVIVMVTPLRAAVLDFLQFGAVTVLLGIEPSPAPTLSALQDLFGETTLAEAQQMADFELRLPDSYGPPDYVYRQNMDGDVFILVWLATDTHPELALYQFSPAAQGYVKPLSFMQDTEINGNPALWTTHPHLLLYQRGDETVTRQVLIVEGNVLIWNVDGVTYRLEADISLEEATVIAETLH